MFIYKFYLVAGFKKAFGPIFRYLSDQVIAHGYLNQRRGIFRIEFG